MTPEAGHDLGVDLLDLRAEKVLWQGQSRTSGRPGYRAARTTGPRQFLRNDESCVDPWFVTYKYDILYRFFI